MSENVIQMEESWRIALQDEFEKPYFLALRSFLKQEKQAGKVIYPPGNLIFNAFNSCSFQDTKVVKNIGEINQEILSLQLQLEEIVRRSQIPKEAGEPDRIRIQDTTRAIPNTMTQKQMGVE